VTVPEVVDDSAWEAHRQHEIRQSLESLGGPPGHITVRWAEQTLLSPRVEGQADSDYDGYLTAQNDLNRAAAVLMAGSLDKLSVNARVALQEVRSAWYSEAPEDPAVVAQRAPQQDGPNPYREPIPTAGPGQLEMGPERELANPLTNGGAVANMTRKELRQNTQGFYPDKAGTPAALPEVARVLPPLPRVAELLGISSPDPASTWQETGPNTWIPVALPAPAGMRGLTEVHDVNVFTPTSTVPQFIAAPEPTAVPGLAPDAPVPVRVGPSIDDFDGWKRYKIPDPITGTVTGRQRVTTFAKSISDQYGLGQWQQRVLLTGAARFPAMAAGAENLDVKADRATLDAMVESIKNAAGAKDKATHGTTVHTYTEHMDAGSMTGEAWAAIPQPFVPDLVAYREEMSTAGLFAIPEMIERTTIHRGLEVAGTLDRILRTPDGEYVIGDVKTGADLSYGWLDIAIQLACYAHGVNENGVWDWETRTWLPAPRVRTDYAIVMHVPAGQGTCTLYRVDLDKGWAAATLAKQVVETRKTRKGKDLAEIWSGSLGSPPEASAPLPSVDEPAPNAAPVFHVQPPTLPGLEPSARPVPAPATDPLDLFRQYARDAMRAAFQQNQGGQAAVYATAQQAFPPEDRIFDELIQLGNGAPLF